ncbi:MAG: lytic transglycosylase domain-containing protein [Clostridia bacterium]|nr:lytic transglycosylase domain-containing protein [Clostridia bacterium]
MKRRKLKVMPVAILTAFTALLLFVALVVIIRVNRDIVYPTEYSEIVERISDEEEISESVIYAVIYTESLFDKDAVSSVGAVGLMQLLPDTADWLLAREGKKLDESLLTDPEFNIRYGTRFLKILYERYGNWDAAHAAYHAGFTRVDGWLEEGICTYRDGQLVGIPIESTETYVNRLRELREKYYKQLKQEEKNEKK